MASTSSLDVNSCPLLPPTLEHTCEIPLSIRRELRRAIPEAGVPSPRISMYGEPPAPDCHWRVKPSTNRSDLSNRVIHNIAETSLDLQARCMDMVQGE